MLMSGPIAYHVLRKLPGSTHDALESNRELCGRNGNMFRVRSWLFISHLTPLMESLDSRVLPMTPGPNCRQHPGFII